MSLRRVGKMGINNTQTRANSLQVSSGLSGPPTNLTLTSSGSSTMSFSWTAPSFTGDSGILSYVLSNTLGAGSITYPTATTANVTGLSASTSYSWSVAAVTSLGRGAGSPVNGQSTLPFNNASGGTTTTFAVGAETWRRHTFLSSSTLTVSTATDPFSSTIVAGGGSGGNGYTGGIGCPGATGGRAGFYQASVAVTTGAKTVTVGGGGYCGAKGGDSSFNGVTCGGGGNGLTGCEPTGSPGRAGTFGGNTSGGQGSGAAGNPRYCPASVTTAVGMASTRGGGGVGSGQGGGCAGTAETGGVVVSYRIS
jgi:hypothetical protein